MLKKYLKSIVITFTVFTLVFTSLNNVGAISSKNLSNQDSQIITINDTNYTINVNSENNYNIATVTDEHGNTTEAIFNKDTEKLIIDGYEIQVEETDISTSSLSKSSNKVLKRKTYTIPASVTSSAAALVAGLAAISNFPFAAGVISAIITGNLWGNPLKITITEYRSASKYTSGTHKGKYKYWTNVLVKCGNSTILNQNHSVSYK